MTTYFITRHSGALAWAESQGVNYDVHLEHLHSLDDFVSGDVIIGTLPINIIAQANANHVRYIHLSLDIPPQLRGIELTVAQLDTCNATLEEFVVTKKDFL